jgi:hypothetical protein
MLASACKSYFTNGISFPFTFFNRMEVKSASWPRLEPIPEPCLGISSVFTPPLNTLPPGDLNKNIPDLMKLIDRVKVFGQISEGEKII